MSSTDALPSAQHALSNYKAAVDQVAHQDHTERLPEGELAIVLDAIKDPAALVRANRELHSLPASRELTRLGMFFA
ncbi:MAG: hypothetical protein AAF654_14090 [Myxococcota bacterium]